MALLFPRGSFTVQRLGLIYFWLSMASRIPRRLVRGAVSPASAQRGKANCVVHDSSFWPHDLAAATALPRSYAACTGHGALVSCAGQWLVGDFTNVTFDWARVNDHQRCAEDRL